MKFTYIIAYRHSEERFRNLQLVLDWLGSSPRDIILVESDRDSKLDCLKKEFNFKKQSGGLLKFSQHIETVPHWLR